MSKEVKNLAIIQARMGSTRLPNKVMKKINGKPLLEYEIDRLKQSEKIDWLVVATGLDTANDPIEAWCVKNGVDCFRGSETDVLDRYYQCSLKYPDYQNIVRLTGDCPLIDPVVVDQVITLFEEGDFDYASNVGQETFPDGLDLEIFTKQSLIEAANQAKLPSEREHVTQYIRNNSKYVQGNLLAPKNYGSFRLTVDNVEDFEVVEFLIKRAGGLAGYLDYLMLLEENPEVMGKNKHIIRNEGLQKSLKEDKLVIEN